MSEEILDQLAADMKTLLSEPAGSRRVRITDLTPRDGQQCKLATRVTTDDLLPLCASIDNCGFYAVEVWGGATFDALSQRRSVGAAAADESGHAQNQAADAFARPTYSRLPSVHGYDRLQICRESRRQRDQCFPRI